MKKFHALLNIQKFGLINLNKMDDFFKLMTFHH